MATGMTCRSVLSACLKFSSYVVLRAIQRLTFWLDRESSWLMRVALRDVHRAGGLRLPWCLLTWSLYLCFFIFSSFHISLMAIFIFLCSFLNFSFWFFHDTYFHDLFILFLLFWSSWLPYLQSFYHHYYIFSSFHFSLFSYFVFFLSSYVFSFNVIDMK